MTTTMDQDYSHALREALIGHVDTASRRRRAWRRRIVGAGAGFAVIGGSIAVAATLTTQPGADQVTLLGPGVTLTHTGSATVALGPVPAGATSIELSLTCLSADTFYFSDGASMSCSGQDVGSRTGIAGYTVALPHGANSTVITTSNPGARWRLTAVYSRHAPTPWARNARGQTYGVSNDRGETPDLLSAIATNGKTGYVYTSQLQGPQPTSPAQALDWQRQNAGHGRTIDVYESDGTTVIGVFTIGGSPSP